MWGTLLFYSFRVFATLKPKIEDAVNHSRYNTNLNIIQDGPGTETL